MITSVILLVNQVKSRKKGMINFHLLRGIHSEDVAVLEVQRRLGLAGEEGHQSGGGLARGVGDPAQGVMRMDLLKQSKKRTF